MPPAARIADVHKCPKVESCPHVGGPILEGEPTVLVGGRAQARVGDPAHCEGPEDVIAEGCATVLIAGKMAARQGDPTAHGGVIAQGELTVLIGRARGEAMGGEGEGGQSTLDGLDCRGKRLFQQEKHMSCAEASSRMVIQSQTGVNVAERTLRDESHARCRYDEFNGTNSRDVNVLLSDHGVAPGVWQLASLAQISSATSTGNPAVLWLHTPAHFVVVDGVSHRDDGDYLQLRDPGQPGQAGCRDIKVGGPEWASRVLDPADPTKSTARVLGVLW
jgi:uncharacterized Zn-binding protein involved in type VI secretion